MSSTNCVCSIRFKYLCIFLLFCRTLTYNVRDVINGYISIDLQCVLSLFLLLAHLNPFVPESLVNSVDTDRLDATE